MAPIACLAIGGNLEGMHACISKGHKGFWQCEWGLKPPPQRSKVNKGPPQEKSAALPLYPPFEHFSLSLFLLELSLSLLQVDKVPLSLACVHGSKVGLEVALHFPNSL